MNKYLISLVCFALSSSFTPQSRAMISTPSFPTGVYLGVGGGIQYVRSSVSNINAVQAVRPDRTASLKMEGLT